MDKRDRTVDQTTSVRCIPQLVEDQCSVRPNAVAITASGRTITYSELNGRANNIAAHLRRIGIAEDVVVGLCLKSSIEMIIGALGVLKAGGAYLPLDPVNPAQRLAYMLGDAEAPVVLTSAALAGTLPQGAWQIITIDEIVSQNQKATTLTPSNLHNLAYVIYTSGSTGQPKGVEIEHASLLNLVDWHRRAFSVTPNDKATQIAGVGFDASVWEVWPYLATGASIHLPDESVRSEPENLRDWLIEKEITITFIPTALAERMMQLIWPSRSRLRFLLTGADMLHNFPSGNLPFTLVNNYGPTECTVVATSAAVPPNPNPTGRPPIGAPITNARVHLLNESLEEVPQGIVGEIHIGGAGVARGYRNRPELTRTSFIPDPFAVRPGERMYKTGDLGRALPNGQIEFVGRIDDQIKIRGYRIEPNEIVAALSRHADIAESAVVARRVRGETRLVAYVAPRPDRRLNLSSLRELLQTCVPDYMIPSMFIRVSSLPMTANGKLDRAALPEPVPENLLMDEAFEPPRSSVEEHLSQVLTELLQVDRIGLHDNFFHLGGHSLLGAQVIARIRDTFDIEISLRAIFDHPTVEALSAEIERLILAKLQEMGDDEAHALLSRQVDSTAA